MGVSPVTPTESGVLIALWVVPGASRNAVQGLHGSRVKVAVAVPAEGGRANRAVAALLEDLLGARPTLESGIRSRAKVFSVAGIDAEEALRKLGL